MDKRKIVILAAAGLAIFVRAPQLFFAPRMWAEEATVYLDRGLKLPWHHALWLPDNGYLTLLSNGTGIFAARLVPLEYAPVVPLAISFLIMLLPIILVLTSENIWKSIWSQAVAVAVILLAVPNQEVWLNSITSQFHLSLGTGIILALPLARSRGIMWLHRAVIILAAAGGAASVLLAPLFLFRAWHERSRERVLHAAILSGVVIVQLVIAAHYGLGDHAIKFMPGLAWLVIILKSILLPFGLPLSWPVYIGASFAAIAGIVWLWSLKLTPVRWLLATSVSLAVVATVLSVDPLPRLVSHLAGNRYFFAPNVLWQLALVAAVSSGQVKKVLRLASGALLIWLFFIGGREYANSDKLFFEGPSWRSEIAAWRADSTRPIHIWPKSWTWIIPGDTI